MTFENDSNAPGGATSTECDTPTHSHGTAEAAEQCRRFTAKQPGASTNGSATSGKDRLEAAGAPPILYDPKAPDPPLHLPIGGNGGSYTEPRDDDDDEIREYRERLREYFDERNRASDKWMDTYHEQRVQDEFKPKNNNGTGTRGDGIADPFDVWADLSLRARRTDDGNALLFASRNNACLRYARDTKEWIAWNGARWSRGDDAAVIDLARSTARVLGPIAQSMPTTNTYTDDERRQFLMWAAASLSSERIAAMPKLAKSDPALAATLADFDQDPMLLNCPNGTVDLRTGQLREHRPEDLITKMTAVEYNPTATCPRFVRFLHDVTRGSASLQHYLQALLGYCATGSVSEEVLPIFYGSGGNGKTKLVEVVFAVLGGYAVKANSDLLVKTKGDKHADMVMHIVGSRFAIATESAQGAHLDERIVKELTGGDTVNARKLYAGSQDYRPTWKLLWRTNDLPDVEHYDNAIRRRVRVVPFLASFVGRENRNIEAELAEEAVGILRWLVDGARMWHEAITAPGSTTGLPECAEVDAQTHEYEAENDPLAEFWYTRCVFDPSYWYARNDLWSGYQKWCYEAAIPRGEEIKSSRAFYALLRRRGLTERESNHRRGFQGIALREGA